jgi:ElaB/YqjD/DUF883 family membrane-anchored ribosome-binding protein
MIVALSAKISQNESFLGHRNSYAERLEEARSRIEQRFLDGGGVLLSILDILSKMIGSLDALTGSLDEDTAKATMGELSATVTALSGLNSQEALRQGRFREIAESQRMLRPHVFSMQETLRYLRTFAVTAKITGAGIADFAGFAEEILQRIHEGSEQVNGFSDRLVELGGGLGQVLSKGDAILARYSQTVPAIVSSLNSGVEQINSHRLFLSDRADQVKVIARGIQSKLASILSAMQIGDITRQRIEHCQSSFTTLSEYLASPDAQSMTAEERERLSSIIRCLVSAQLAQSRAEFDRDTAKIVDTIASFRSELLQITQIQRAMAGEGDEQSANALGGLEKGVSEARTAVREIEAVAKAAGDMTQRTLETVKALLDGIGLVQIVRGDIHYMALNTNLRCGKIGEEGKAINVVTAELRIFAGHLDDAAEKILVELRVLEGTAEQLLDQSGDVSEDESLDERLERALQRIHAVAETMEADLERMAGEGHKGVEQMNTALAKLDFKADLGEVLRRCASDIAVDPSQNLDFQGLEQAIMVIGPLINRTYTMASEREIHAQILGTAVPEQAPLTTVLSDDDLDAALF